VQKHLGNQPFSVDNSRDGNGVISTELPPLTTEREEGAEMADSDSTSGRAPAFQFYPKDFLADERVRLMSMPERGVYITAICLCWSEGTLPADSQTLSRLMGMPVTAFRKLWPALEGCFRVSPRDASRLIHPRLERERQKQRAYRRRQADNGRKGGRPPQSGKPTANPSLSQQLNQSPSSTLISSSSSSTDSSQRTNVREFPATKEPTTVEARAGIFTNETYPALYAKHRKGARYVSKPNLDFLEAIELCRVWDDDRLTKIATVFLTTDHSFAESGSRTMAQFRALASWCDSRLAEAGIA
jgi:uncharacterized protein YdaU (DUF1376 family)